jgi:DMSO/TMAO reductase YedYZ molybdopterin-dependent catalytic subunit
MVDIVAAASTPVADDRQVGQVAAGGRVGHRGRVPVISRGFHGRRDRGANVPPGQYVVRDFPVLSAGPTPRPRLDRWSFTIATESGAEHSWTWAQFQALPAQRFSTDIHCVTKWSKLGTEWEGVSLDTLLDGVDTDAAYALATCDGGYTTNVPMSDLRDGQAWIAYGYGGAALTPEHGGPARLLVPHLYLWKSAKWVRRIELRVTDEPGFWERLGYHNYGDPWREQRYWGD